MPPMQNSMFPHQYPNAYKLRLLSLFRSSVIVFFFRFGRHHIFKKKRKTSLKLYDVELRPTG